ncbi:hypothetical protein M8J76_003883 [Diaphorina citri]|nr:hypothetical protein M8J76_003883 [Diaphorina citri]
MHDKRQTYDNARRESPYAEGLKIHTRSSLTYPTYYVSVPKILVRYLEDPPVPYFGVPYGNSVPRGGGTHFSVRACARVITGIVCVSFLSPITVKHVPTLFMRVRSKFDKLLASVRW